METKSYLYYVTLNGYLRVIELQKKSKDETDTHIIQSYVCTITEKYLITGLYLGGQMVNPHNWTGIVECGLLPIEPFLFVASNKMFQIHESEYRIENKELFLKFFNEKKGL